MPLAGETPVAILASTFRAAFTERAKEIRDWQFLAYTS